MVVGNSEPCGVFLVMSWLQCLSKSVLVLCLILKAQEMPSNSRKMCLHSTAGGLVSRRARGFLGELAVLPELRLSELQARRKLCAEAGDEHGAA